MPTDKEKTWSPEPWRLVEDNDRYSILSARGAMIDGSDLRDLTGDEGWSWEQELANAKRKVSCVNACSGMSDPEAWIEGAKSLADRVKAIGYLVSKVGLDSSTVMVQVNEIETWAKRLLADLEGK